VTDAHTAGPFIAAIDQGTTSSRCIVFDTDGRIVSVDQKEHEQIFPKPGWVEHDATEIWTNVQEVVEGALRKAGITRGDLQAIGITNQRETTVLWDRATGKPVHNAIVWQDTRTDALCKELGRNVGQDRFRRETGLPLASYFAAPKIRWLLDNVEGLRERAERGEILFGTMDTWVIWNLTGGVNGGVHVTDVTNASRTLLMNLHDMQWDEKILASMGVPAAVLPEIRSSAEVYGTATGVLEGVPVASALGDQQAALFGQTCFSEGEAKSTYGTGTFLLMNTGDKIINSYSGLVTTVGYRIGDEKAVYALEGSIAVTGSLVQWMRDQMGLISTAGQWRRLLRARLLRSVRTVLALGRAWCDHRSHPLRHQGPPGPRRAGGHCLADPGDRRCHAQGLRRRADRAQGRRRHDLRQPADADHRRRPRRPCGAADGRRDDLPRCRLRRRPGRRLLARHRRPARQLAPCSRVDPPDGRGPTRPRIQELAQGRPADHGLD
jgi:ribulose kinase